jgi:hypothetical protein
MEPFKSYFFARLARVFLFLPSVTFGVPLSEIFPWGWANVLVHRIRLKPHQLLLLSLFGFVFLGSLLVNNPLSVLTTFASYLNPLLAFFFVINCNLKTLNSLQNVVKVLFAAYLVLGLLQILGFLNWLSFAFDVLIPRGGTSVAGGGRGVSLLSTEPSRAGIELVFLYATLCLNGRFGGRHRELLFDILVLFFILLVVRSFIGLAFFMLYFGAKRPLHLGVLVLLSPAVIVWFDDATRSISIIKTVLSAHSISEIWGFIFNQSGFRLISVYSAYVYGFNQLIGHGIGSWESVAAYSYVFAGFSPNEVSYFVTHVESEFVSLKPTAWFSLLFLELGATFGLLITGLCLYIGYKEVARCSVAILPMVLIFLVSVFLTGAVGNPIPWVCLAMSIRISVSNRCND